MTTYLVAMTYRETDEQDGIEFVHVEDARTYYSSLTSETDGDIYRTAYLIERATDGDHMMDCKDL